jgi:hypothetical protein
MITKFKIFENNNKPQVGDYVYCIEEIGTYTKNKEVLNFIKNNIGRILGYYEKNYNNTNNREYYLVKYENIPNNIEDIFEQDDPDNVDGIIENSYVFYPNEIIDFSKEKKDLEKYLDVNKYNL